MWFIYHFFGTVMGKFVESGLTKDGVIVNEFSLLESFDKSGYETPGDLSDAFVSLRGEGFMPIASHIF
jgi:hypothetical protein